MQVTENANTIGTQRQETIEMPVDTHFAGQFATMLINADNKVIFL